LTAGSLFVGTLYWYLHLQAAEPISIDGVYYDHIDGHAPRVDTRGLHLYRNEPDLESGSQKSKVDPEAEGAEHGG
jgi:hypothetical protein